MPRLQASRYTLSSGDFWATTHQVAITPSYLYVDNLEAESPKERQKFADYCKDVEKARLERPLRGCRTLQDEAIETVLKNMHRMSYEALISLSPRIDILKRIWRKLETRQLVTFDSWTIFSRLLSGEADAGPNLFLYGQSINQPTSPLHVYTGPMTSTNFDFVTCLSITASFPTRDLQKLSLIRNLATLELVQSPPERSEGHDFYASTINDRLIRMWAELASSEEKSFPLLRMLRFVRCTSLSEACIRFLNGFPALAVLDIEGFDFDILRAIDIASQSGWLQVPPDKLTSRGALHGSIRKLSRSAERQVPRQIDYNQVNSPVLALENDAPQFSMYRDFMEIGKRRRNRDLEVLGLCTSTKKFHDQPFCQTPTAVVRLGSANQIRSAKRMVFTRFDYGMQRAANVAAKSEHKKQGAQKRSADNSVRKGKRQNLGNVMGMFM